MLLCFPLFLSVLFSLFSISESSHFFISPVKKGVDGPAIASSYLNKNSSATDPISQVVNSVNASRSFFSNAVLTLGLCHSCVLLVSVSRNDSPTSRQLSKSMRTGVPSSVNIMLAGVMSL
ncbi:hypothetical protein I7I48_04648 [Histoplasma ohiense]|nr:hypothetical protein I7I48_04648 [Histoplasma ohiense (nom. inval.)]